MVSIHSKKFYVGGSGSDGAGNGANALPWSWKESSLLCMLEAYEFCLMHHALQKTQMTTAAQPSKGSFEGIKEVFAAVGLGGALQPQPAGRGMLLWDLFENLSLNDSQLHWGSQANGQGLVIPPLPEAHLYEMTMMITTEGGKAPLKNLLYPFPGFGQQESGEQEEQTPFPLLPGLPDQGEGEEHNGKGEESQEGVIVVMVEEEEEEEEGDEEEGEEGEETQHCMSGEPSSFPGHASNLLSSLCQPIPSHYLFTFHHPLCRGSVSSMGLPPFAFSHPTATSHSKGTLIHVSHDV
jgi:hypothetical protein